MRNCRSAITCYWGNPRYGAFIAGAIVAGVIAIWGAIVTPYGAFVVGAIIVRAIITGGIVAGAFIVGAIVAGVNFAGAFVEEQLSPSAEQMWSEHKLCRITMKSNIFSVANLCIH